jgi:hypothetical protein
MNDFIKVDYRNIDGVHVFTSHEVPGLYVASADAREAFESVSEGISLHLKLNKDLDITVDAAMSADEFLRFIGAADGEMVVPHPAVLAARDVPFRSRPRG